MNGLYHGKLAPLHAECWAAWKLGERDSLPIALDAPETLDEVVNQALTALCWQPGDALAVQYSHAGLRKFTLWQFTVRRSSKVGFWRESTNGGRKVFVGNAEPKLHSQTALAAAFAPIERFDAFKDDAVGVDRELVEVRS